MSIVNHVGLCVTDLERSRRFYEQVLGFTWDRDLHVPDAPTSKLLPRARSRSAPPPATSRATPSCSSSSTSTARATTPSRDRSFTEPGLTHLSFSVDDVPAACQLVTQHGGEVLRDTDVGGLAIMVRDPDGQVLELLPMSYRTG